MPFTTKSIVHETMMAPGVENRQHAFGVFMDTFNAMRNYFLEHYEKGIGMFIPSLGAFFFDNIHDARTDRPARIPRFVFLSHFLTRSGLQCPKDQNADTLNLNMGSLFETKGPMHRINWTTVAGKAGLTPADCKEAWDLLLKTLQSNILSGVDGSIDFGIGTFTTTNFRGGMKLKKWVQADLCNNGTLGVVKTNQAMTTLGTFRVTEQLPRGTTIIRK
ncbi:hypothetical protein GL50803_0010422 [Giardia duodenalis]|uniref:Uncharacterized protein n=1 Tax=Giardia intestinalis (strain ATCC 50803 / WB clone C6) TaxID=184922 RepID=A8BM93_GIAIC|nr:hypothetical protein GL50803_0010422 [Giardia intestinalis]KAE8303976.1 hypothetical protein GL50803_0010422 [Giardia intestinalis]|eukprot:XP_001706052.1 Hypothetical protein GL50803_10422 [Giardia lamblia ATCC 50803]